MTDNEKEGALFLNIAEEYSAFPAGRYDEDGPNNGTKFRKELLLPRLLEAIDSGRKLVVSLDGLKSCGSSFLSSAFAGLITDEKISKSKVSRNLEIRNTQPQHERYKIAIIRHISAAGQ
ncbi:STAS-like domain-containing protein [Phaeobacter inhibens]|uniref:STAS-like domain-containing protein n=1 Tax=Phaeobacter inhibens TaxID=221822 RepID=UPI0021A8396F|nr:STAS-like domain-containing protein [Phaeobacter inhibens]UWS06741.1 STAS-like domain-containing protein [Phaeobacter inhibens]